MSWDHLSQDDRDRVTGVLVRLLASIALDRMAEADRAEADAAAQHGARHTRQPTPEGADDDGRGARRLRTLS